MTDQPTNIIAALARVTAELGGIEKLSPEERRKRGLGGGDERGVSYAYRGVDQIAAAAGPLFGKYGVVVVPDVVEQTVESLTINGKPWTDTAVEVVWTLYGPGGLEDRIQSRTRGLGRDNSDKGPNKALTQSYKNLLLRLLCIGDPADDADGHTHEADAPKAEPVPEHVTRLVDAMNAIGDKDTRIAVKEAFAAQYGKPHEVPEDKADEAELFIIDAVIDLGQTESPPDALVDVDEGGEGAPTSPEDPPAPSGPVTKPAKDSPAARIREGLKDGTLGKPALGAVRNEAPTEDDGVALVQEQLGGEVVGA